MPSRKTSLVHESLEPLILVIRNQRVILDADLAHLYGVPTKVFNQAVKRNAERFPVDFAFQLTAAELKLLRSQFVTSSQQTASERANSPNSSQAAMSSLRSRDITAVNAQNWSQFATSSHGGRRYRPGPSLSTALSWPRTFSAANRLSI